jgi:hypothetical protein
LPVSFLHFSLQRIWTSSVQVLLSLFHYLKHNSLLDNSNITVNQQTRILLLTYLQSNNTEPNRMCFHISHWCDQNIPRWVTNMHTYVRFEVNKDTPFLVVTWCVLVEIYRQCEENNLPPFSGSKTDTSTRRHIPQRSTVTITPLPQFKLARFSCNFSQSVLKTTTEWRWDLRQNLFQLHASLFTIECYILIFTHKFKFRFCSDAMEFKCSLLLNSDGSLYL